MKKASSATSPKGFSLIEAIIAVAVFSIFVVSVAGGLVYSYKYVFSSGLGIRAANLAEEGLEVARNIRDSDFSKLVDGTYGLSTSGNFWSFSGSQDSTDVFDRSIIISSIDSNTKEIVSEITWPDRGENRTISLSERLTNWQAITNQEWNSPSMGSCLNLSGNSNGIKVQISGDYAYIIRASSIDSMIVADISDLENISETGSVSLFSNPSSLAVSGDYVYVASTYNTQELQIVNANNPSFPYISGSYNLSTNTDAKGIYVSGSIAYVTRSSSGSDEFYTLDISNTYWISVRDSLNLNGSGSDVVKLGNYAYVASDDNSAELKVVNVSNSSNISLSGSYNLSGNTDGLSIAGFDNTVLLGRSNGLLYIFDVSNPSSPQLRGQFDVGGSVNDIVIVNGEDGDFALLATSAGSKEFQAVNISDVYNPSLAGSVDMDGVLYGVAYDSEKNIAVTTGSSDSQEFCIVSPQ